MNQPKKYYRGLADLEHTEEFVKLLKREFPEVDPETLPPISRRRFVQLLGASASLAAAGCRWEDEKILTFNERPENRVPGVPQRFATALEIGGVATPLLMTTFDGRPVKAEGNPEHPMSGGATHVHAQASVLGLYDPDRSKDVVRREGGQEAHADFDAFLAAMRPLLAQLRGAQGQGLAILSEETSSATVARLRARLQKDMPKATWHVYEPLANDAQHEGTKLAFGAPMHTLLDLSQADVIACLDADVLGNDHPSSVKNTRDFARRRDPDQGPMNRLYAVESNFSVTGAMADHRLPLRSGLIGAFVAALEAELGVPGSKMPAAIEGNARVARFAKALARDLAAHKGRSVVAIGRGQAAEVQAHVHRINAFLGNAGKAVAYAPHAEARGHVRSLADLTAAMNSGGVDTLLILGGNPAYDAPADLDFAAALAKVAHSIHLSLYRDETSRLCTWHLPRAHALESWGDARAADGTLTIAQPTIAPLYGGKSAAEVLAVFVGDEGVSDQELVRATFSAPGAADVDSAWRHAVHDGFVRDTAWARTAPAVAATLPDLPQPAPGDAEKVANGRLELNFIPDSKILDGRFANNGWLQELPDFMTKVTWDNVALIGASTARELGVETGKLVELAVGGRTLEMAAYVLPGHASGAVTVALGYGRPSAGVVGGHRDDEVPPVGFDTYRLRASDGMFVASGLEVRPTRKDYPIAMVQEHHMIDTVGMKGRQERLGKLIHEADVADYEADPESMHGEEHVDLLSLWKEFEYDGHRWGMAIDLTKCTGCNACVVACQSENNIPIVGKEAVIANREMHWIRIDRYFSGEDLDDPSVVSQPLPCQQCENAPCEQVCPVGATMHSSEGLNDMVYNRCVGTRYCSNNCPYKVRRFNFFNYHLDLKRPENEVMKMIYNPEVTIRARGVMEKCTYCVQRIQNTRIHAKVEKRPIKDGEIVTACAQTCPAEAITFGDLNDPTARVLRDHANPRTYRLLEELNIKPRTAYLGRVRNPNPELAKATAAKEG